MSFKTLPRLTGHETFVCRFAWLPKLVAQMEENSRQTHYLFKDLDEAIVRLGVGKNMVRSIKFWGEVSGLIQPTDKGGHELTTFGKRLLGHEGHDPYLEKQETLWLLHWKISTARPPIFYWNEMLNHWHRPEFSLSEALPRLQRALPPNSNSSVRTISDGFKVFIRTYVPSRSPKGDVAEDNLDCPLIELGLINETGLRSDEQTGKQEPLYSFNYEDKPEITDSLFAYCLNDFWMHSIHTGDTLSFGMVSTGQNSPGQIFKLPELAVRSKLERLSDSSKGTLSFMESSTLQQVVRNSRCSDSDALDNIYLSSL